jgi:glycerate kinase
MVACDVQNPFYGPQGAARVFARQKGADDAMIAELDEGMKAFARLIHQHTGKDISQLPGSGAAGGLGGCLAAYLNAELKSGADLLLDASHFETRIQDADLVITGEGKIDQQSLMGKITGKILERASRLGIPVIAFAGQAEDIPALKKAGFRDIFSLTPTGILPTEEDLKPANARIKLQQTTRNFLSK